ncbi:MAG: phenylalanine--tRNA ligase subunit beta [Patescibacteria group bacterium]|nr:phenylalanine--tRNA ligase subunit beta [Patescibacteria group bacterium]
MQLSLNWLKDFVNIPKSISPEELGLRLTIHTVEIDSVKKQDSKFNNIIVGRILEIKKHPNADRLQAVQVDVGKNIETHDNASLQVVCGAPNIKVGQMIPVALAGAILPNGMGIKQAEVRGIKSCGMLCSENELGLGDDSAGIMILEKEAKAGQSLADYLKLKDVIFEVDNKSITHRPDLWSHYGMAREIAAFLNVKLRKYKHSNLQSASWRTKSADDISVKLDVKVDDFDLCPRYMAVAMDGIKIEPSPKWMRDRLVAVGMRPINNIVDITNYVMLELGQPLHAFDASLISANNFNKSKSNARECKIIVRQAKKGEILETLDGEKRELDSGMLVIADSGKPIAIAGVMGGASGEISNETNSIIIESANFNFVSIRKTQQKLGLRTESSMRFEKALDPNLCELALARIIELVKKICPKAKVVGKLIDKKKFELDQGPIRLDLGWLDKRVGQKINEDKVIKILERLGFGVKKDTKCLGGYLVSVPTWRATRDIAIPEDLVEEAARIYGYDNLIPAMPRINMGTPEVNQGRVLERKIKSILSGGAALTEVYNYSFVGREQLEKLNIDFSSHIMLSNPIAAHQTMLRQSLAPNLIENIKANQAKFQTINIFEIGSIYLSNEGELEKGAGKGKLPYQEKKLGIILAADKKAGAFNRIKGIVEYLLLCLDFTAGFAPIEIMPNWADKNVSAEIKIEKEYIGLAANLDDKIAKRAGIKKQVAIAEISLKELFNLTVKQAIKKYQESAKFPPIVRDLAFVINEKILYNDIRDEIINFNELIKSVKLFDVYCGGKLGAGKKNLAFHITYLAPDKTLTANEADKIQQALIKHLAEKFEAKIRDF